MCYVVNIFFRRIRQPKVVSEVITGIILGPSIMGKIPGFNNAIFPKESIPFLTLVANLGLVLFLFLVGLELDPKLILKRAKYAVGISITGLLVPFVFSCGIALLLYKEYEKEPGKNNPPPFGQFLLACGMTMSLTAFPVLARCLAEMQLMSTTVGFITVCSAAAGDIVAWTLMALLISLINSTTPIMPLYVVLMAIGFCLVLVFAVRPLLMSLVRLTHSEEEPSQRMIVITLIIVLSSAFITNIIGIHSIFGGFLIGLMIPHDSGFAEGLTRRLEDLVGVYFLPIFFTCSGLKTQVSLLNNGQTWGMVILVTLVASFGKMIGCVTAAKTSGLTWRESISIGFLMNCKGLVEYLLLNISHDAGILSDRVFVILITMCVLLTMMTTPFVGYLYPVSYQKELEVRREAEKKKKVLAKKQASTVDDKSAKSGVKTKGGFFAGITNKLRRRDRKDGQYVKQHSSVDGNGLDEIDSRTDNDNLEDIRIDIINLKGEEVRADQQTPWKQRNGIMFCLDKTPNAPGVMTLLQLFSGTTGAHHMARVNTKSDTNSTNITAISGEAGKTSKNEKDSEKSNISARYKDVLQPSIDISDPEGNRKTKLHHKFNREYDAIADEYEVNYSKIYAIRLLHISERTSAAMLTASRCMDRLYKDTVMMMVMAFAKLNSVPLRPLVAISTDAAQSTVAQDILSRAEDLNVRWIVYPWNSSHLTDLPSSYQAGQPLSGSHLQPGIMMSIANTSVSARSAVSIPGTPVVGTHDINQFGSGGLFHDSYTPDSSADVAHQFPYNISRYFDHDEAQKIASGGHVFLSSSGQSHRTSIASNTKVLSKLIPTSAESNISTAVLVDRGLGLFGGVEHLVVPLLGGQDDYETLCLASCLARSTRCFVTILRISAPLSNNDVGRTAGTGIGQAYTSHSLQQQQHTRNGSASNERSVPPTPYACGSSENRFDFSGQSNYDSSKDGVVPKDDETLFKKFFPCKPLFLGDQTRHQRHILEKNRSAGRLGNAEEIIYDDEGSLDGEDEKDSLEEGIMALSFQELNEAILWARSCLTAQDLMVIGFNSPATTSIGVSGGSVRAGGRLSRAPSHQSSHILKRTTSDVTSRVASLEDGARSTITAGSDSRIHSPPMSPPSILERRGITLSPPLRADSPHQNRLQTFQETMLPGSSTSIIPAPVITGQGTGQEFSHQQQSRSGRLEEMKKGGTSRTGRSHSRGNRSISRSRKSDIHSASLSSEGGSLTTCQVMLGLAADKIIQSGVVSSLLVVRSRWFLERSRTSHYNYQQQNHPQYNHTYHGGDIPSQFRLHTSTTGGSFTDNAHEHKRSTSEQSQQQQQKRFSQYRTEQQKHHSRRFSQEMIQDLAADWSPRSTTGASGQNSVVRTPDVTFVDTCSDANAGEDNDLKTPRMSGESS
ncbi:K(+)/H(+) antiporter [Linnemannia zychae]|nr:K(+)/H(+) antiporter [Linnemannia zychae]